MARPKLTPEDMHWIETRLNQAVLETDPVTVTPRNDFVQRSKAQLLETDWPQPPNRKRQITLWAALMLVVAAIFVSILHLRQRAHAKPA